MVFKYLITQLSERKVLCAERQASKTKLIEALDRLSWYQRFFIDTPSLAIYLYKELLFNNEDALKAIENYGRLNNGKTLLRWKSLSNS